ncbi:class A beta-lactamase [Chitinimonas sp.]|uniref:class A beta-lactamase n=1 Tax=Chitinimonas sp. TaxID=1934313 RepID=UPI0039C85F36
MQAKQNTLNPTRRKLLLAAAAAPIAACTSLPDSQAGYVTQNRLAALEAASGGRLGVASINTANGAQSSYRADERFPFCSTFKVMVAAGILQRSAKDPSLLARRVAYPRESLVAYSPITEKHAGTEAGMSIAELCAATLQYSDNTAGNLLIKELGGPAAVTAFARSLGDTTFRLDRWETELNTAIPNDPRDTTSPAAMAQSLQKLLLGDALGKVQQVQLTDWMLGNTTGALRIRAGVPTDWQVADKTGSGAYGTTNDIGLIWPKGKPPIVLAIYYTRSEPEAAYRNEVLAMAARIVAETLTQ